MITNILLYIFASLITLVCWILPKWQIWPSDVLDGITYFFQQLAVFNFIFPIDTVFNVLTFLIYFEVAYFTAKLVMKFFNYIRGTGSGLDL